MITKTLLDQIADRSLKRMDVALTYAKALKASEVVEWEKVNRAILIRWSQSGLDWIKNAANYRFGASELEDSNKHRREPLWKCYWCRWWNGSNHAVCQKCDKPPAITQEDSA